MRFLLASPWYREATVRYRRSGCCGRLRVMTKRRWQGQATGQQFRCASRPSPVAPAAIEAGLRLRSIIGDIHAIWLIIADWRRTATGANHFGHKGEHDGVAMAHKFGLYDASMANGLARTRADRQRLLLLQDALAAGADGSLYAVAARYPEDMRDMAFTTSRDGGRSFSTSRPDQRGRMRGQWVPDDGPRLWWMTRDVHLAWPTVIDGVEPEGADLRHIDPRRPALHATRPHPDARRTETVISQIVADRAGRIFVAWDESVKGRRVSAVGVAASVRSGTRVRGGDAVPEERWRSTPSSPRRRGLVAVTAAICGRIGVGPANALIHAAGAQLLHHPVMLDRLADHVGSSPTAGDGRGDRCHSGFRRYWRASVSRELSRTASAAGTPQTRCRLVKRCSPEGVNR